MLTGDYPPHDVWKQSRAKNIRSSKIAAKIMLKHFAGKKYIY